MFRSITELVVNAVKHSGASSIALSAELDASERLQIRVVDDGRGFDSSKRHAGFGLFSIERRMACMNGTLEIQSSPGAGTTALLRLRDSAAS